MIGRGLMLLALSFAAASAQQRQPAFEIYGLTGAYFHGNVSVAAEWKPQFGAGVLAPLGRNWGALVDVTSSAVEGRWNYPGTPAGAPAVNFSRERRIALLPSLVRLWRRDRFSVYAGAGIGAEHARQKNRVRPVIGRDAQGAPVLADHFEESTVSRTEAMVVLRIGTLVNLTPRVVVRAGFSWLPRYMDEKASKSVELGVGYRF